MREYCLREYFIASCPRVGDVILVTSALYGRMRIGRCIRGTFNIGCSNDVTALFDDRCPDRRRDPDYTRKLIVGSSLSPNQPNQQILAATYP